MQHGIGLYGAATGTQVVGNTIGSTTFNSGNIYPSTYDALGRRYAVSAKLKF